MAKNSVVRARIDENVKNEAAAVLAGMGLSVSDAFRMLLVRIAAEKQFPFDVRVPNTLTAKTLAASDRGEDVVECKDKADLFQKLGL
jgi:DNA-damage-inducible protein J